MEIYSQPGNPDRISASDLCSCGNVPERKNRFLQQACDSRLFVSG